MELKLSERDIYFFFDETPSYAIKHNVLKDSLYRIIKLAKEDKIEYVINEETSNLDIYIGGKFIDSTVTENIKRVKAFAKNWNDSLEYINLTDYLNQNINEFLDITKLEKLKVKFFSWNLAGLDINELDVSNLKSFENYDMIFFAFQEFIPLTTKSSFKSSKSIDNSIELFTENFKNEYEVVKVNKLFGMVSILLVKSELKININKVETHSLGTGFMSYGNKGSILTKILFNDYILYFTDFHLCTGENAQALEKRRNELFTINTNFKLSGKSNGSIVISDSEFSIDEEINKLDDFEMSSDDDDDDSKELSTKDQIYQSTALTTIDNSSLVHLNQFNQADPEKSIIFVGGDLNYRLNLPREQVLNYIEEKNFSKLLEYDSLKQERIESGIFQDFKEGEIKFFPTYRFLVNENIYDNERTPSYTDRILVSNSKYIKILKYNTLPRFKLSDHLPVFTDYELSIPLINRIKRKEKIDQFHEFRSKKVNDNTFKDQLVIENLENVENVLILHKSTVKIKLKNTSKTNAIYFNIINNENDDDTVIKHKIDIADNVPFEIKPLKDIIPPSSERILSITTTLPIGLAEFEKILILRVNDTKDFFITTKFIARKSYFGSTLFEIAKQGNGGIPKPLYSLIDYLSNNLTNDIFCGQHNEILERDVTALIDNNEEIPKSTPGFVVANVLLLLLKNIDGGIISNDLATFLFDKKQDIELEDLLEQLPPLNVNVLIYLISFLRICYDHGIPIDLLLDLFQNLLIDVPKTRKRDFLSSKLNYEKLRNNLITKLVQS